MPLAGLTAKPNAASHEQTAMRKLPDAVRESSTSHRNLVSPASDLQCSKSHYA